MSDVFTMDQIREKWAEYRAAQGWRVLRDGKWKLYMSKPDLTGGATRAEMIHIKNHLSFPKYLETVK